MNSERLHFTIKRSINHKMGHEAAKTTIMNMLKLQKYVHALIIHIATAFTPDMIPNGISFVVMKRKDMGTAHYIINLESNCF